MSYTVLTCSSTPTSRVIMLSWFNSYELWCQSCWWWECPCSQVPDSAGRLLGLYPLTTEPCFLYRRCWETARRGKLCTLLQFRLHQVFGWGSLSLPRKRMTLSLLTVDPATCIVYGSIKMEPSHSSHFCWDFVRTKKLLATCVNRFLHFGPRVCFVGMIYSSSLDKLQSLSFKKPQKCAFKKLSDLTEVNVNNYRKYVFVNPEA